MVVNNVLTLSGNTLGIFAYGRVILKKNNQAQLRFVLKTETMGNDFFQEKLLTSALQKILTVTRFGRIGILYDRKNIWAKRLLKNPSSILLDSHQCSNVYAPSDKRAVKTPEIQVFEYQVLRDMAQEGLSGTVEFRRLARKYLRPTKHAHCDTLLLLDDIMGEESTRKQWQALAGTQQKIVCLSDFVLDLPDVSEKISKQNTQRFIELDLDDFWVEQKEFVYARAEQVLRTKLNRCKY